jgi:hypothetical protein
MERRAILRIDPWIERIWVPGHTPLELGCLFERNRHRYRDRTPRQGFAGLLGLRTHPANDTPLAAKLARHTALVTRPHVRLRCRLRTGPEQRRRRVCQRGHQRHVLPDGLRQDLVDEGLVADGRRLASLRNCRRTPASSRIAISCRGASPSGGRPTRRIARSWSLDALGTVAEVNRGLGAPRAPGRATLETASRRGRGSVSGRARTGLAARGGTPGAAPRPTRRTDHQARRARISSNIRRGATP